MVLVNFILAFLISWFIGIASFWLIARFSTSPPPIYPDLVVGAFIIEALYFLLKGLPWLLFWLLFGGVVWVAVVKLLNIKSPYHFFGAVFYITIKVIVSLFLMFQFISF